MANKFNFKLLTGADPQAQYDAIATKDALTFYLLNNGIGYLGTTKLFDATNSDDSNIITNMLTEGYTGDDTTVASTKAIVDYVTDKVGNISTVLTTSFFRKVESHTITAEDLTNVAITVPAGVEVGEVGLLFTADVDNVDGGETYFFVSLKDYLTNTYSPESTNSINMDITADNKVKADLNIASTESSIVVDANGVHLEKATEINDGDGTGNSIAPSASKLVTEEAVVNYFKTTVAEIAATAVQAALEAANVVTYSIDSNES